MLRPATPLSIVFLAAFVLLLLSTLSTPVIKSIPLASYQGVNLGVLGYCKEDGTCKGPVIGYSTDGLFSGGSDANNDAFSLPSDARHSLSSILIVHPIAALLALICFGLAVAAHFHGPSHSPKYLLALLILTFPTLLVTLLAFLVDILLFVPHMQWGGWIVLGATLLIIASSIVTCAMRRTLVSRKARKKRIAENADMNGAAYYENLAQNRIMVDRLPKGDVDNLPRAESPPPMSGSTAVENSSTSQFATFEMKRQETRSDNGAGGSYADDRVPLNPQRDPSIRSTSTSGGPRPMYDSDAPPMPRPSQEGGGHRRPSRDQYGNPIAGGAAAMGMAAPGLRHEGSQGNLGSSRNNAYPPRGRGYGPPNRGFGPPRGRGGYGGPPFGFAGRGRGGGYGPPSPGFNGPFNARGRGGYGPPPPGMMGRGRPMPPPGYGSDVHPDLPRTSSPPPPPIDNQFVAGPAMPIGQAIEMDERTGSAAGRHVYENNAYGLRDSDGDVAGMVGLMQGRADMSPTGSQPLDSPSSLYSDQNHRMSPRQQWSSVPSPLRAQHDEPVQMPEAHLSRATFDSSSSNHHSSAAAPSSRALPLSPVPASPSASSEPRHRATGSETYYEDVDPRFAQDASPPPGHLHPANRESGIPNALTPGPGQRPIYHDGPAQSPVYQYSGQHHNRTISPSPLNSSRVLAPHAEEADVADDGQQTTDQDDSDESLRNNDQHRHLYQQNVTPPNHERASSLAGFEAGRGVRTIPSAEYLESIPDGARSPGAASESSHFTSVSQRGINPNWRPGFPVQGPGPHFGPRMTPITSGSAPHQRRNDDVILSANPDFSLAGIGIPGARGGTRRAGGVAPATGLTPAGRYPTPDVGMGT